MRNIKPEHKITMISILVASVFSFIIILIVLFLNKGVGLSLGEKIASPTVIPTKILTPTPEPIFYDESIVRDDFDLYPNTICESTQVGWDCTRDLGDRGTWRISYMKSYNSESYFSMYSNYFGLYKDNITDVLATMNSFISNHNISDSVMDWMLEEGISEAAYNKGNYVTKDIKGMRIGLLFDEPETIMTLGLCYGIGCGD